MVAELQEQSLGDALNSNDHGATDNQVSIQDQEQPYEMPREVTPQKSVTLDEQKGITARTDNYSADFEKKDSQGNTLKSDRSKGKVVD